jgi:uncharacterized membrane protein
MPPVFGVSLVVRVAEPALEAPMAPGSRYGLPDPHGHLRSSTADRERVVDALKEAFAEGRLNFEEYEQRAGQALGSRTYAELAELTADLPAGPPSALIHPAPGYLPEPAYRPVNRMAIASLVCAVLPGLPLLAVFFGLIAHGEIRERGERGAGLATAGILIGGFFGLLFMMLVLR